MCIRDRFGPRDVLHAEHEQIAKLQRGICGDDVGVLEPGGGLDLAEEAFEEIGAVHDLPPHHLEHFITAHQLSLIHIFNITRDAFHPEWNYSIAPRNKNMER